MPNNSVTDPTQHPLRNYLRIAAVLLIIALVVAWRWTPLSEFLNIEQLLKLSQSIRQAEISPLIVVPCLIAASLLMVPLSIVIIVSALLFGSWWGFVYAFISGVLSGSLGFYIGSFLGSDVVNRLAGKRIHKISEALGKRGILAVIGLRVVPVAPFTVQNMVAGATHIRHRDFNIGNAIGLLPAITAVLIIMNRIDAGLESPDANSLVGLVVAVVAVGLVLFGLGRWLVKHTREM